jgi:DNA-binding CsgD family transcriptional regulator
VLQLIAEGDSSKEIAQRLRLSVKTVESHRAALMERPGVRGTAALVRCAIRLGILRPES